jgi:hypothetical protein
MSAAAEAAAKTTSAPVESAPSTTAVETASAAMSSAALSERGLRRKSENERGNRCEQDFFEGGTRHGGYLHQNGPTGRENMRGYGLFYSL